jgi:glycosyltransferase involved in cell wall biosynthesis
MGQLALWRQWIRAGVVRALARMGLGKAAKLILGRSAAERLRDWMLWERPGDLSSTDAAGHCRSITVEGSFGVNIVGWLCAESGVGEAVRSGIRSLRAAEVPLTGTRLDIAPAQRARDQSCVDLPGGNPHAVNLLWVNADMVPTALELLGSRFFEHRLALGHWAWELEAFPEEWLQCFEALHEVWVASSFCQDAVSRVSPVPVIRMPYSVEVDNLAPVSRDTLDIPEGHFVFLYTYDYYSFAERKNPIAVVRAFQQAFGPDAPVHLVLKATDSRAEPDYHARVVAEARPHQVTIIDRYLDRAVLNGLTQRCDCYVSLHRSEGFGLTIAEAMYLGKPVIVTAYGGSTDFTRPGNSYLVRYDMVPIEEDHGPYRKGCMWADPDVTHASELMRRVFEDRQEAADIGQRAAEHIRSCYSRAVIGARMRARLERLIRCHGPAVVV